MFVNFFCHTQWVPLGEQENNSMPVIILYQIFLYFTFKVLVVSFICCILDERFKRNDLIEQLIIIVGYCHLIIELVLSILGFYAQNIEKIRTKYGFDISLGFRNHTSL